MAWTAAMRAKAEATRAKNKLKREGLDAVTAPKTAEEYLAEIAELKAKLGVAEKMADRDGEFNRQFMGVDAVPTGKFVTVKRLNPKDPYKVVGHKDDGRDILRPNFVDVELPTFFYTIDM